MSDDFRSFLAGERQRWVAYVRSLLSETAEMDAEDVVDDVLLKLLERVDLVPGDNFVGYVYRLLRNRVIDRTRTSKPGISLDRGSDGSVNTAPQLKDETPSVIERLQTEEGRQALFAALDDLKPIERELIIAHEFEGIPFKELSTQLNIPQNTLISHKARGIARLRCVLRREENSQ